MASNKVKIVDWRSFPWKSARRMARDGAAEKENWNNNYWNLFWKKRCRIGKHKKSTQIAVSICRIGRLFESSTFKEKYLQLLCRIDQLHLEFGKFQDVPLEAAWVWVRVGSCCCLNFVATKHLHRKRYSTLGPFRYLQLLEYSKFWNLFAKKSISERSYLKQHE